MFEILGMARCSFVVIISIVGVSPEIFQANVLHTYIRRMGIVRFLGDGMVRLNGNVESTTPTTEALTTDKYERVCR